MTPWNWFEKFVGYATKYGPAVGDMIGSLVDEFSADNPELREPPTEASDEKIDGAIDEMIDKKFPQSEPPSDDE